MRRLLLAGVLFAAFAGTGVAVADQPGPGDDQCAPGQHGNPHPGFKAGVCDNP